MDTDYNTLLNIVINKKKEYWDKMAEPSDLYLGKKELTALAKHSLLLKNKDMIPYSSIIEEEIKNNVINGALLGLFILPVDLESHVGIGGLK